MQIYQDQQILLSDLNGFPTLQGQLQDRFSLEIGSGSRFNENLRLSINPGDFAVGNERLSFTLQGDNGGTVSITLHASDFSETARDELNTLLANTGIEVGSGLHIDDDLVEAFSELRKRISRGVTTPLKKETLYAFGVVIFKSLRNYANDYPRFTEQKTIDLQDFTPAQQLTILSAMKDCLIEDAREFCGEETVPFPVLMAMHRAGVEFNTEELLTNLRANCERFKATARLHYMNLAYLAWVENQAGEEPKDFDHTFGQIFGRGDTGDRFYREPIIIQTDPEIQNAATVTRSLKVGQSFLAAYIEKAKTELANFTNNSADAAYKNPAQPIIGNAVKDATVLDLRKPEQYARAEDFKTLARISQVKGVPELEKQYIFLEAEAATVLDRGQFIFHQNMDPEVLEQLAIKMASIPTGAQTEASFRNRIKGLMYLVSRAGLVRYQRGEREGLRGYLRKIRYQVIDQLLPHKSYSTVCDFYKKYGLPEERIPRRAVAYADQLLIGNTKRAQGPASNAISIYQEIYGDKIPEDKLKLIERYDPYAYHDRKKVLMKGYGDNLPIPVRRKIAESCLINGELDQARTHYAELREEVSTEQLFKIARELLMRFGSSDIETGRKYLECAYEEGHRKLGASELYTASTMSVAPSEGDRFLDIAKKIEKEFEGLVRNLRDWHDLIDPDSFTKIFKPEKPEDYPQKTYREHLKQAALRLALRPYPCDKPHPKYKPLLDYCLLFNEDPVLTEKKNEDQVPVFREVVSKSDLPKKNHLLDFLSKKEDKKGNVDVYTQKKKEVYGELAIQCYILSFPVPGEKLSGFNAILTHLTVAVTGSIDEIEDKKRAERAINLNAAARFASEVSRLQQQLVQSGEAPDNQIVSLVFELSKGAIAELNEDSVPDSRISIDPDVDRKVLAEFCVNILKKSNEDEKLIHKNFDRAANLMRRLGPEYEAQLKPFLVKEAEKAALVRAVKTQAKRLEEAGILPPPKQKALAFLALTKGDVLTTAEILKTKGIRKEAFSKEVPTVPKTLLDKAISGIIAAKNWKALLKLDTELRRGKVYVDTGSSVEQFTLTKDTLQPAIDYYVVERNYRELCVLGNNRPELRVKETVSKAVETLPEGLTPYEMQHLVEIVPGLRRRPDFISRVLTHPERSHLGSLDGYVDLDRIKTPDLFTYISYERRKKDHGLLENYKRIHDREDRQNASIPRSYYIRVAEQILSDENFVREKLESGTATEQRDLVAMAVSCRISPEQNSPLAELVANHPGVATRLIANIIESKKDWGNSEFTHLFTDRELGENLLYVARYFDDVKLAAFIVNQSGNGSSPDGAGAGPTAA